MCWAHGVMGEDHAPKKILLGRQFATCKGTSEGRAAALIDHGFFSITAESGTGNATTQQRTRNGQGTTNHTDIQIYGV